MASTYRQLLDERFGGLLRQGKHKENGIACAVEVRNAARGKAWSDDPGDAPDTRALNDGPWSSDEARTAAMVPVEEALWDWADWTDAKRQAWATEVARRTIGEVLAIALRAAGLNDEAGLCEREPTEASARSAEAAAGAAEAAAGAAGAEAAARAEAADETLQLACRIWIEAA
jgi:hypothetical protein